MRFHCGLSFRPKFSFKWLLLIGAGLFALFSNILTVNAETFNDAPNMYYYRDNVSSEIFPNVLTSSSDYYYYPTNSGFNAYNFTTIYYFNQTASNVICPSGYADVSTRVSLLDTTGNYINDGLNFTGVNNGIIKLASIQNGYADVTFENVDLTKNLKFVTNASYGRQTQVGIFAVHRPLTITCKTADWQYINNNNNENTEKIVGAIDGIVDGVVDINDSITDDSITTAGSTGGSFFNNFSVSNTRGFSDIITAPIRMLQSILTHDGCEPLALDLTMSDGTHTQYKNLTLPCGDVFWSHFPNAVVLVYHTMIFGLFGYRILIDMYKFINNCLNPEYSKEYYMDL